MLDSDEQEEKKESISDLKRLLTSKILWPEEGETYYLIPKSKFLK
jgi:hypothetical protein